MIFFLIVFLDVGMSMETNHSKKTNHLELEIYIFLRMHEFPHILDDSDFRQIQSPKFARALFSNFVRLFSYFFWFKLGGKILIISLVFID